MTPLEAIFTTTVALWFVYFLINHAEVTAKVRAALFPALPTWLATLLACPLCLAFWTLCAISLFWGWTPLTLWCPPCVLMWDLAFRRMQPPSNPSQPTP